MTITHSALIAHGASTYKVFGKSLIGRITIRNNVFIGFNSIVLPGTTIGNNVIVCAGSVVAKDVPDDTVVLGSVHTRFSYQDLMRKRREQLATRPVYNLDPLCAPNPRQIQKMLQELEEGIGFN